MFCMKCGSQIPDGAQFCPSCGAPITSDSPAASAPGQTQTPYQQPQAYQQPQMYQPQAPVQPTAPQFQQPKPNLAKDVLQGNNPNAPAQFTLFGMAISLKTGLIALGVLVVLMIYFASCA